MEKKKREWWPIGILLSFAVFIGGILIAVSIMMRNDVPLTSDDYYAREIAYQEEIDKSSRALTPARKPELRPLPATEAIEITFPGKKAANQFSGKAVFFRPSDPSHDFSIALAPDSLGLQWINMHDHPKGLWILQIEWMEDETPYYYEQQILM
jgi:nitrogen fixation protein FixH